MTCLMLNNESCFIVMRILELVPLHLRPLIQAGDCVVDATAGNGYDCLWLAEAVGCTGCVHAFDIQPEALQATQARLLAAGLDKQLQCHLCSHAEMAQHVPAGQRAILFNLGYLPGAQHQITTQVASTLSALEASLHLLAVGGRLSVMAYPGHEGGQEEYRAVSDFFAQLPLSRFTVICSICHNGSSQAPVLFTAQKQ